MWVAPSAAASSLALFFACDAALGSLSLALPETFWRNAQSVSSRSLPSRMLAAAVLSDFPPHATAHNQITSGEHLMPTSRISCTIVESIASHALDVTSAGDDRVAGSVVE